MNKYITALLLAITLIPIPAYAGEKNEKCLEYDPAVVEITGTLKERTFCCEDWILEDKGPFTYWVVEPVKPICVWAPPNVEDGYSTEYNVDAIQLLAFSIKDMYERYKHFVSKKVVVTGLLSHRTTGHHRTRVMIDVKNIKSVKYDKLPFVIISSALRIPCLYPAKGVGTMPDNKTNERKYIKVETGRVEGKRTVRYTGSEESGLNSSPNGSPRLEHAVRRR